MSIVKKIGVVLVVAGLMSTTALADASLSQASNEGAVVFKARAGYLGVNTNVKNNGTNSATQKFKNGYVGELAVGYFFTDNIAAEGSIGFGRSKVNNNANVTKIANVIPVTAIVQYHFMPDSSVSPYVGVGYSYQVINGAPTNMSIKNGGGVVGQLGLDIPFNDTMGFNIDAKYTHKAQHDITDTNIVYKNTLNTTAITVGVTFPF